MTADRPKKPTLPIRVCYPFVGNNIGGSHISALLLAEHLDCTEAEPVIVLHEVGPLADYILQRGLNFELIPIPRFFEPPYRSWRNLSTLLMQTWRIAAFLRKNKIDLVHSNDLRIHFGWILATRLAGAKLILHHRSSSFSKRPIELLLAKLSHQVVCISQYTRSMVPKQLASRTRIIENPFEMHSAKVDRYEAKKVILERLGIAKETQLVGFFGNLAKRKQPLIFLQAAARISDRLSGPLAFLVLGDAREHTEAEMKELAEELGIGDRFCFMGFQSPVEPWIAACDLVLAPAIHEGLGRSVIEAMIGGTPVVAADSGGHRETIRHGDTGYLVKSNDPEAFAETACLVLKNPMLAQKLAERAREEAIQRYSIQTHIDKMMVVYREAKGVADLDKLQSNLKKGNTAPRNHSFTKSNKKAASSCPPIQR